MVLDLKFQFPDPSPTRTYYQVHTTSTYFSLPPSLSHRHAQLAMSGPFLLTLLISLLISLLGRPTSADTPECPYPCLPPPSSSGGAINSYPPPQSSAGDGGFGGSYPPPPPGSYQLTPPGVMPGFSPPYGGFPSGPTPPPPNPVLPWFPWYYQHTNPVSGTTTSASSPAMDGRSMVSTVAVLLALSFFVL
ncbi:hypothetical protein BS78_02G154500 [Paspalum vaginatum]|nr:hypothetical protein BS78_02G154500 [Paspalum vaginatum]